MFKGYFGLIVVSLVRYIFLNIWMIAIFFISFLIINYFVQYSTVHIQTI